jgi:hypothetical protein
MQALAIPQAGCMLFEFPVPPTVWPGSLVNHSRKKVMLKTVMLCLFVSFSAPALAIYKCKSGDQITYSIQQCAGGEVMDTNSPPSVDTAKARRQAAEEQRRLKRLENERRKQEAREEKERQRAAHDLAAKQKRCSILAKRKQWADEDVAASAGKSVERARVKARRVAEQYQEECAKISITTG